ncbi:hypothetical protein FO519_000553 [Halicephalobus sp. NKZ332]|nr:hypothetical protein FO519_000553 [Halicephalobus sp. NKZ332]
MDNVDFMVLSTLEKLGCSFCEEHDNLAGLDRDDFVEGVVKLLWTIDDKFRKELPDLKLSPHAAKKFQSATTIADTINGLGFKEKIGYQSILYPNVFDIRKIFINLIEKLPEEKVWVERELSPFEQLTADVSKRVEDDFKILWVPPFCRRLKMIHDGRFWNEDTDIELISFRTNRFTSDEIMDRRYRFCQILNDNNNVIPASAIEFPFPTSGPIRPMKPIISRKPVIKPKPKPRTIPVQPSESENDEIDRIASEIAMLSSEVESVKHEIMECQYAEARLEDDMIWIKDSIAAVDPQLLELLSTEEDLIPRLTDELAELNENIMKAQDVFIQAEQELEAEYSALKAEKGLDDGDQATKGQLETLREVLNQKTSALNESRRQANVLRKRVADIVTDSERAKYRKEIMEVMRNIDSQYKEKNKIYNDNCTLVKEIEHLNGILNRTYAVVEKWMTNDAYINKLQQAYRNLVAMHERCYSVRELIKECSAVNREIDELLDEIEIQSQNAASIHLDELMTDIAQIRQENHALQTRGTVE